MRTLTTQSVESRRAAARDAEVVVETGVSSAIFGHISFSAPPTTSALKLATHTICHEQGLPSAHSRNKCCADPNRAIDLCTTSSFLCNIAHLALLGRSIAHYLIIRSAYGAKTEYITSCFCYIKKETRRRKYIFPKLFGKALDMVGALNYISVSLTKGEW
jgi:hypothetical protein